MHLYWSYGFSIPTFIKLLGQHNGEKNDGFHSQEHYSAFKQEWKKMQICNDVAVYNDNITVVLAYRLLYNAASVSLLWVLYWDLRALLHCDSMEL